MKNTTTNAPLISRQKLEELFNDMPTPVVEWSARGEIVFTNDAFCNLTGFDRHELIGSSFYTTVFPGHLERQWDRVREDLGQLKAVANHVVQLLDRQGETISMSWTTVLKTNCASELQGIIGLGLNLSCFSAALRELLFMANVLEASNGFISPTHVTLSS